MLCTPTIYIKTQQDSQSVKKQLHCQLSWKCLLGYITCLTLRGNPTIRFPFVNIWVRIHQFWYYGVALNWTQHRIDKHCTRWSQENLGFHCKDDDTTAWKPWRFKSTFSSVRYASKYTINVFPSNLNSHIKLGHS